MRIVALLLAIVMMAGCAAQLCDGPDVISVVDDVPDMVAPRLAGVELARPDHRPATAIEAPLAPAGRAHAVLIFRPPR